MTMLSLILAGPIIAGGVAGLIWATREARQDWQPRSMEVDQAQIDQMLERRSHL